MKIQQIASLGYIPIDVVKKIRKEGKKTLSKKEIDEKLILINTTIIRTSRALYYEHLKEVWDQRKKEGVPIKNKKTKANPARHLSPSKLSKYLKGEG